jgi:hypothetical protein
MPSSKLAIGDEQTYVVAANEVLSHPHYRSHQRAWFIVKQCAQQQKELVGRHYHPCRFDLRQ